MYKKKMRIHLKLDVTMLSIAIIFIWIQVVTVNGDWTSWNTWEECSVTCGKGYRQRTRVFRNYRQSYYSVWGIVPSDDAFEIQQCTKTICLVNGNWNAWNTWGECSVTCGKGYHHRVRKCNKPPPSANGLYCEGNAFQTRPCNVTETNCSVVGNWGIWSSWGVCNSSCFIGVKKRTRVCDSPSEELGGEKCIGSDIERKSCSTDHCLETGLLIGVSAASVTITVILILFVHCIRKRMRNGQRQKISSIKTETKSQKNNYTKSGSTRQSEKNNVLKDHKAPVNVHQQAMSASSDLYEEVDSVNYENDDARRMFVAGTSAYEMDEEYEYIEAK